MFNLEECNDGTWSQYFHENMDDLGLSAPKTLAMNTIGVVGSLGSAAALVEKWGPNAKATRIVRQATNAQRVQLLGAVSCSGP